MRKNIYIFWLFSKYSFETTFQHTSGMIIFIFGKAIRFVMLFLFIYFLLSKTKLLAGYNLNQTIIFFLVFNLIDNLAQLFFREVYRFRPLIISGDFDTVLIKPYHPFLRILFGGIDIMDFFMLFPYLFLLLYFTLTIHSLTLMNVIIFIGLIINSLIIAAAFHILVLSLGVLTTEIDHAVMIYRDITKLGMLPIDIYTQPLRTILTFIIPIGIMMTFPAKALFGILKGEFISISFYIAVVLFIASLELWKYSIKKYQSWGG